MIAQEDGDIKVSHFIRHFSFGLEFERERVLVVKWDTKTSMFKDLWIIKFKEDVVHEVFEILLSLWEPEKLMIYLHDSQVGCYLPQ